MRPYTYAMDSLIAPTVGPPNRPAAGLIKRGIISKGMLITSAYSHRENPCE